MEEELRLDIGPALETIRGDLSRALDQIPEDFRRGFGDALQGIVSDFGAAADLAREELSRVGDAPIPITVDTSALEALPGEIDAAGGTVDATVAVDTSDVAAAADEVKAIDGETVTVAVEADTTSLQDAQDQVDALSGSLQGAGASAHGAGAEIGLAGFGVKELSGSFTELGGSALATKVATGGLTASIGLFVEKAITAQAATHSFELRTGDLADTLNRVDVAGLDTSLGDLALKVGASGNAMRLALANFVALGEGSGKTRGEIGSLGQSLSALSAYLSVTNPQLGSADEIIQRLPNALARGGRFLAQYGIALTTAEIQQRALADTGKQAAADLTIFDKSAAGLALTMEKLGDRLGTGIEEGSKLAEVRLRSLQAELSKTAVEAGKPLIEPVVASLEALQPTLIAVTRGVGTVGGAFAGVLAPALRVVADVATPVAEILDRIPKPLIEAGAAAYLAVKGLAVLEAATTLVTGAVTKSVAAITATEGPLTAYDAAQIRAAEATAANAAAQEALQVASGEAVAFATANAEAESAKAAAMTAAAAAAAEETAALEALASAEAAASSALGPIAVVVAAAAATFAILSHRTDELKLKIADFAHATDDDLTRAYDKFQAIGEGKRFFTELAAGSIESATQLRDALGRQGRDVTEFTKLLDEAARHQKQADQDKALSSEQVKAYTAALKSADSAERVDAANALKASIAYEALAPDVRAAVDAIEAKDKADKDGEKAAADNAAAIQAQADAANAAESAFSAATSALATYLGLAVDQGTQALNFAISLDKLRDSQTKSTAGYKLETAAGRENISALADLISKQAQIYATNIKNGEFAPRELDDYRKRIDAIKEVAKQTGITDNQFNDLLDSFNLTPEKVETAFSMSGIPKAREDVDKFRSDVEKVPLSLKVTTTLDISQLYQQVAAAREGIRKAVNAPIIDQGDASLGIYPNAEGNVYPSVTAYAAGGIRDIERYAQGAAAEDHTAQITTGYRLFGEPETGGEAYIPLAGAKRARSTMLLDEVAGRFGYDLVPVGAARFAGGDVVGGSAAWDDGRMVGVLLQILSTLVDLPEKIPVSQDVNAQVALTQDEEAAFRSLGRRLRSSNARR